MSGNWTSIHVFNREGEGEGECQRATKTDRLTKRKINREGERDKYTDWDRQTRVKQTDKEMYRIVL